MKDKMTVKVTAEKVYRRKIIMKALMIIIAIMLLFSSAVYGVLYVVNKTGNFTISLDPNLKTAYRIAMSPREDFKQTVILLQAKALPYMDNITESWLPDDIDNVDGEHSGANYIAYTFYIQNQGTEPIDYMSAITVQAVIKGVDEAVRVAVYHNGVKTTYAKKQKDKDTPEPNTTPFISNVRVMEQVVKDFSPNEKDKFTVVIWLEGNDPQCVDDILGGELKLLMVVRKFDEVPQE